MTFVIATGCCNDASCVEACPVDCIRPHPDDPGFRSAEQLYIDPGSCIDCGACMYACPVSAIHDGHDLPDTLAKFARANSDYFVDHPLLPRYLPAPETTHAEPLVASVAVVGSGPAGCYVVAELSAIPGLEISVFDRLPTPFGLVRSGVAPDHPHTKLISDYFQQVIDHPQVTCHFNVEVGTDVTIEELRSSHHAVIYAGGAPGDRKIDIPGEMLPGSHSAREFVNWYNAHPDYIDTTFDLADTTAVVLGNGNVALDVARILTRPLALLETTDIADHALAALRASKIRDVVIVARRGVADAACSFPELLELTQLPDVEVRTLAQDFPAEPEIGLSAPQQRKVDLFRSLIADTSPGDNSPVGTSPNNDSPGSRPRRITFRFGLQPAALTGGHLVEAVELQPTHGSDTQPVVIKTSLVLRAVGYQVERVADLPYEPTTRTLAHKGGRLVTEGTDNPLPGFYCVGWAKRGPTGVIGTNKACSKETVAALLTDLRSGLLPEPVLTRTELDTLVRTRQPNVLGLTHWDLIDKHERLDGRSSNPPRPRRKLTRVKAMLDIAADPPAASPPPLTPAAFGRDLQRS